MTLRLALAGLLCLGLAASGQTNLETDSVPDERLHDLRPLPGFLKWGLWALTGTLLAVGGVVLVVRHRVTTNLYKEASHDDHWGEDAEELAAERVDGEQVAEACAALEKDPESDEAAAAPQAATPQRQGRLFTPASGPAWSESMLKAFLTTCMKVNCLGRTWRESATWRGHSPDAPDPREAELVRRLMQRWQEFHLDPEVGVFVEHSSPSGRTRVCLISFIKDKRTLVESSINAGFVIECLGRYLKHTDLVYRRGLGEYHAPTKAELAKMTPGEKESMIRVADITDPWQAMIGFRDRKSS